jgi:dolichol-phosphate mannosyltransferase
VTPRVSVVIPVYNEGAGVVRHLERILREVLLPAEILVVHDTPEDTTVPYAQELAGHDPRVRAVLNTYGPGRSLRTFARVGTRDATNSFKAYDTAFVREVGIESRTGFEIGIELTAKATRLRRPVAEIPTIWLDRQLGETRFDVGRFLPSYLRWYFFAFGRRLTATELAARWAERRPDAAPADRDKEGTPA